MNLCLIYRCYYRGGYGKWRINKYLINCMKTWIVLMANPTIQTLANHLNIWSRLYVIHCVYIHICRPTLVRVCVHDIELPNIADDDRRYTVRKGDFVLVSNWCMGRNPKVWGEDALLFKPELWVPIVLKSRTSV
eukprot:935381_1